MIASLIHLGLPSSRSAQRSVNSNPGLALSHAHQFNNGTIIIIGVRSGISVLIVFFSFDLMDLLVWWFEGSISKSYIIPVAVLIVF